MEKVIRKMEADIPSLPLRKRVAAYARVSSGKDAMLHSLSAQVSYYSEHIQSHPEWEYAGVYVDEALTGTKDDRDGFQRLLADCRAGKIDMVLTKSISRFARNTATLLETVRELKTLGVDAATAVYVGDTEVDLQTAQNAGLAFTAAGWGYRTRAELEALGSFPIAEKPLDLPELL